VTSVSKIDTFVNNNNNNNNKQRQRLLLSQMCASLQATCK